MIRICLLLLSTAFTLSCHGQNRASQKSTAQSASDAGKPKIINPERKTPFPYNHFVSCGIQDKNGNFWFGTSDGIYRYDGKLFTNYRIINGLNVDRVSRILEDRAG